MLAPLWTPFPPRASFGRAWKRRRTTALSRVPSRPFIASPLRLRLWHLVGLIVVSVIAPAVFYTGPRVVLVPFPLPTSRRERLREVPSWALLRRLRRRFLFLRPAIRSSAPWTGFKPPSHRVVASVILHVPAVMCLTAFPFPILATPFIRPPF